MKTDTERVEGTEFSVLARPGKETQDFDPALGDGLALGYEDDIGEPTSQTSLAHRLGGFVLGERSSRR